RLVTDVVHPPLQHVAVAVGGLTKVDVLPLVLARPGAGRGVELEERVLAVVVVDEHHAAPADAAHLRVEHALHEGARDRGVDGIAAALQDLEGDLGRRRLRADDSSHGRIVALTLPHADTPRGYSDPHAGLRQGQADHPGAVAPHRGAGQGHREDGRGRSLLHRRPDPGQRHPSRPRKRGSPAPVGPHGALRDRSDPLRQGHRQGPRAQPGGRAPPAELTCSSSRPSCTRCNSRSSCSGKSDLRGFLLACGFGAASSSCSYAAVALARTLFRRGASFANAIIFEFASTNLVFELGLVLLILLGWQFLAAEFAGGLLMAVIIWILFKVTLRERMVAAARAQADRGVY